MKTREQREIEKKFKAQKQEEQERRRVAQAIEDLQAQRKGLSELINVYDDMAYIAAKEGKDELANEIIETITEIEDFNDQLSIIETRIVMETKAAQAMKTISSLAETLAGCKSIFARTIDVSKIGKNLSDVMNSIASGREQFRALRQSWKADKNSAVYQNLFGEPLQKNDPKFKVRVEERKKSLEARLARDTAAAAAVPADAPAAVTNSDFANVADIAAMLDDERNK